jgi:uncharacterized phage infection (PIP) family protein YhgE
LQLVSSSGTFPVETENSFFVFISKILPFTYTVQWIRELFVYTDTSIILRNLGILFIYICVLVPFSLVINLFFDYKTRLKIENTKIQDIKIKSNKHLYQYDSFAKDTDDM